MIKQVVYVQSLAQPAFTDVMSRRPDVALTAIRADTPDSQVAAALNSAHAYHLSSGVNQVDAKYLAGPNLLAHTPALLVVSTMGAGYDTVDIAACTVAGIIGLGQIGRRLGELCRSALSMRVLVHDPNRIAVEMSREGAQGN